MKTEKKHGNETHGLTKTRFYRIWRNMLKRCEFEGYEHYHRYGGRGISFDESWRSFDSFYKDMFMGYTDSLTLERVDNDKDYSKENCKWSSMRDQCRNRSSNRYLELGGREMILTDWAKETGIKLTTIRQRIDVYGWSVERALTTKI